MHGVGEEVKGLGVRGDGVSAWALPQVTVSGKRGNFAQNKREFWYQIVSTLQMEFESIQYDPIQIQRYL